MTWFGDQVTLKDGPQLDAFGRLRVSMPVTLFDSQQEYGLDTRTTWDATANGTISTASSNGSVTNGNNAVGPRDSNTRMTPITVSTTSGHYSILQSRQYLRYIPGKSHLVFLTGVFASGSGSTAKIFSRTSTSGSVVDNEVSQSDWNIDKLDGTGVSGITIDFAKTQILAIQAQWLGVGRVIIGFDIDGCLYPAHEFLNANNLLVPYTQSFNLPVRCEIRNTGAAESKSRFGYFDSANGIYLETTRAVAGGTVNFICASVQTEGGEEARGFPQSASNGITAIGVTTRRPVLSIRPKATFNSLTNRAHIELADFEVIAKTNDCYFEIVVGGTLTGAAFSSVNADSVAEFDISATAISGGVSIIKGFCLAGSGSVKGASSGDIDVRNPLTLSQIDALTANQIPVTIVATSFTGTSNVQSIMNWHEQTI
jgi:hypothetical protein